VITLASNNYNDSYYRKEEVMKHLNFLKNKISLRDKKFVRNAEFIIKLIEENELLTNPDLPSGVKDVEYKNELRLKYWDSKIVEYCNQRNYDYNEFLKSRVKQYSIQRIAWYNALKDDNLTTIEIGSLFKKSHSNIVTLVNRNSMKYNKRLRNEYFKIKEFINE